VEAFVHPDDQRSNIPTAELETFLTQADRVAKRASYARGSELRYPRDAAGDPQLVWRGKDELDHQPLDVLAPPIYIQEKIHPKAIIEDLRAGKHDPTVEQPNLFEDFNGIPFQELVDFYQHGQHWSNRLILGDSLEVMSSLAEREGLKGQVQCAYIDPPYGIDFRSNWQVSTASRDVTDGRLQDATRQPEQVKAFRDTWRDGIHTYLSYLRDRIQVVHTLLSTSGSIFVQIGEKNQHLIRSLLDEVFGAQCHVVTILIKKKGSQRGNFIEPVNDYIHWYAREPRESGRLKYRPLFDRRDLDIDTARDYPNVEFRNGDVASVGAVPGADGQQIDYRGRLPDLFRDHPGARLFAANPLTGGGVFRTQAVPFAYGGREFRPGSGQSWKHSAITDDGSPSGMQRLAWSGRLIPAKTTWRFKRYLEDFPFKARSNWWDGLGGASNPTYVVQTNVEIVKRCILMTTDPGDLVLDPTCGSGTSAYVAEQWGRRWITIDTSRVALALARQRIMASRFDYYQLLDQTNRDLRKGFQHKQVPHVTSSTIANAVEIREGMSPEALERAIGRSADQEVMFDQPAVDPRVVRVTGPFTVESLSPPLSLEGTQSDGMVLSSTDIASFNRVVIDNLRAAGIQNSVKGERLRFMVLEPWAGRFVHAVGEYEENSRPRRAAICIGPQYGTVDTDLVREAAKEVAGYFDLLVVCGLAFDGRVETEIKQLGGLTVLKVAMNPDLSIGGEPLRKTSSANLFMIFGEPDIEITDLPDGKVQVQIRGVDTYDPTSGQVKAHTTDDIACWFIDTNYNAESFFVRHAYFAGGNDPYEALRRALKADIDPDVWQSLYSTVSRPFSSPTTGRIAVKVISHYGDEVMKVYSVRQRLTDN
jgi:adenine-specific DNA-methyltransferase